MLNQEEVKNLTSEFHRTFDTISDEIITLSASQLNFRPEPHQWSVAECIEHLIIMDTMIYQTLSLPRSDNHNNGSAARDLSDDVILREMENRGHPSKTPPFLEPKLPYYQKEVLMNRFEAINEVLIDYLTHNNDDIRARCAEHPLFGLLNGYHWLVFLYAHRQRHTGQIRYIKDHGRFPAA